MANKSFYTFMKIKAPDPSRESLAAFTRKVNEQFEMSAMKLFGNIESKDLHPNLQKTIKAKVENATFETYIQQTAQEIELLATKEEVNDGLDDLAGDVNAVAGTVSTHTTQIQQNAEAIALKADQTTVNAQGETISSLSSQLSLVPGQITAEVTNKTVHVSDAPPSGDGLYEGRLWQNTLTDEQLRWRGLPVSSARSYPATKSGPAVVIDDLSDDRALRVTVKNALAQAAAPSLGNQQPLVGKSEVTVVGTGKNLLRPGETVTKDGVTVTVAADGTVTLNGTCTAAAGSPSTFQVQMSGFYLNGQFTISMNNPAAYGAHLQMRLIEAFGIQVSAVSTNFNATSVNANKTFALENQYIWGYAIRVEGGVTYNNVILKPQLEPGASATPYEPYNGAEYTLSLPAPAYGVAGATDDVNNIGQVAYRTKYMKFSGTEAWIFSGSQPTNANFARFQLPVADIKPGALGISSAFGWIMGPGAHTASEGIGGHSSVQQINVFVMKSRVAGNSGAYPESGSNADKVAWFKALMAYYKPEVVYELAAPATPGGVAPVPMNGVDGTNIVAGDGASIAVEYTGSGWQVISGKANSLYASANMKFDVNGLEIRQVTIDGEPVDCVHVIGAERDGYYKASTGEFLGGVAVRNDELHVAASSLTDPRVLSDMLIKLATESVDGDKTGFGMRMMRGDKDVGTIMSTYNSSNPIEANHLIVSGGNNTGAVMLSLRNAPDSSTTTNSRLTLLPWGLELYARNGYNYNRARIILDAGTGSQQPEAEIEGHLLPLDDNEWSCGRSDQRWTRLFAANGSIGTSDERHKQDIAPLDPAEMAALLAEIVPIEYRFKDNPGELRYGFGAWALQAALDKRGLSGDLQIVNKENPDCYGLNNEQIIPILAAAMKHQQRRIEALEARIESLEARLTKE